MNILEVDFAVISQPEVVILLNCWLYVYKNAYLFHYLPVFIVFFLNQLFGLVIAFSKNHEIFHGK